MKLFVSFTDAPSLARCILAASAMVLSLLLLGVGKSAVSAIRSTRRTVRTHPHIPRMLTVTILRESVL
jgi:hypothetical protein